MRPYKAFYRKLTTTVEAASSYEAQQLAAAYFKARKSHEVTVLLADVTHSTGAL